MVFVAIWPCWKKSTAVKSIYLTVGRGWRRDISSLLRLKTRWVPYLYFLRNANIMLWRRLCAHLETWGQSAQCWSSLGQTRLQTQSHRVGCMIYMISGVDMLIVLQILWPGDNCSAGEWQRGVQLSCGLPGICPACAAQCQCPRWVMMTMPLWWPCVCCRAPCHCQAAQRRPSQCESGGQCNTEMCNKWLPQPQHQLAQSDWWHWWWPGAGLWSQCPPAHWPPWPGRGGVLCPQWSGAPCQHVFQHCTCL